MSIPSPAKVVAQALDKSGDCELQEYGYDKIVY